MSLFSTQSLASALTRHTNRAVINAWGGKFTINSLNDVDQSCAVEKQFNDRVFKISTSAPKIIQAHVGASRDHRHSTSGAQQYSSDQTLRDHLRIRQRTLAFLQRGLILLHLGCWAEAASMCCCSD